MLFSMWLQAKLTGAGQTQPQEETKKDPIVDTSTNTRYFNRINFREIKFRDFANFCPYREIETRENAWN